MREINCAVFFTESNHLKGFTGDNSRSTLHLSDKLQMSVCMGGELPCPGEKLFSVSPVGQNRKSEWLARLYCCGVQRNGMACFLYQIVGSINGRNKKHSSKD